MKTISPPHPHTAELKRFETHDGKFIHLVAVQFKVPSRIAALLPEGGDVHYIPAADIGHEKNLARRAQCWRTRHKVGVGRAFPTLKSRLAPIIKEGCDTSIMIALPVQEWHLVGVLCGKLRITPGQWFLACADYNACLEEETISRMLADLPPAAGNDSGRSSTSLNPNP